MRWTMRARELGLARTHTVFTSVTTSRALGVFADMAAGEGAAKAAETMAATTSAEGSRSALRGASTLLSSARRRTVLSARVDFGGTKEVSIPTVAWPIVGASPLPRNNWLIPLMGRRYSWW